MKNILVIGESCVDKFVYGNVNRLSPEAPVPVFNPIEHTTNGGMAANVVANLKALNSDVEINLLTPKANIVKTRFVDSKSNHMFLRVDEGEAEVEPIVWTPAIRSFLDWADLVIVSDYNKGYLYDEDIEELGRLSALCILDSKRKLTPKMIEHYSFIKLNESESRNNYGLKHEGLIITLGSKGAYYNGELIPQNSPQQTIDVSGAGDTFVAAFALCFLDTFEAVHSIEYANEMAGKVVKRRGVVTP